MAGKRESGGEAKGTPRLPKEAHDAKVLSDSKLGRTDPTDPAGESAEQALSESKLGAKDTPPGPRARPRAG